jgi:uncharacterized membrane protein
MRFTSFNLRFPAALSMTLVATSLGCGACTDEHAHDPTASPPVGPQPSVPALIAAHAELRARCGDGLVPPAQAYATITEIPGLGDGLVFMQDINDDGVAVGSAQVKGGGYHAIRFTDPGGVQDLGALPGFGTQSYAAAIAPDGAIGGHSDRGDGTGTLFGYRYTATGGRVQICPGGCSVWDLNAAGQVVGLLLGRDTSTWQAFVWSPKAGLESLGTLGGARSSASAISESGLVAGNAQLAGSAADDVGHAFLYDARAPHPALQDLNARAHTPGWVLRAANDVNDKFVVGYGLHDGQSRAFRMTLESGQVDDLGTLGTGSSVGWAVDGAGDVVGWVARDVHTNVAIVYGAGLGGLHALDDFVDPAEGWQLEQANGINAHGAIVGMATHHGQPVGFELTLPLCAR